MNIPRPVIASAFASLSFAICAPKIASSQELSCSYGKIETVTACSHLSVIAGWEGGGPKSASCTYNPPAGWAIIDTQTIEESSNNGHSEVNTLAENLNFATEREVKEAYDRAIDIAVKSGNKDAEGHLKDQRNEHLLEVQKYSTNKNTVYAKVYAEKHGSWVDRKRGWQQISVTARVKCLGGPDDEMLFQNLKKQFNL